MNIFFHLMTSSDLECDSHTHTYTQIHKVQQHIAI